MPLHPVRAQYPSSPVLFTEEPLVIHWGEGMSMLKEAGHEVTLIATYNTHILHDWSSWGPLLPATIHLDACAAEGLRSVGFRG